VLKQPQGEQALLGKLPLIISHSISLYIIIHDNKNENNNIKYLTNSACLLLNIVWSIKRHLDKLLIKRKK